MTIERKTQAEIDLEQLAQAAYDYRKKYDVASVSIYSCNISDGKETELRATGRTYDPDIESIIWWEEKK